MANPLDKLVSFFSPEAGLRRAQARASLDAVTKLLLKRSYDGASKGRLGEGWIATGTSASSEIRPALADLRNRSRELVRNNPFAAHAVESLVSNIVGNGILPKSQALSARTRKTQLELWNGWVEYADFDRDVNFYGLQALAVRTIIESGEVLIRRHIVPSAGEIPLQLQVLEPDYIDTTKNMMLADGGFIIDGIEFDRLGRKVAFWLYNRHPGDSIIHNLRETFVSSRVAAADLIHVFRKHRPGQYRGVPWFAPVMMTMRDLDEYEDAELLRKKIEACFVAFVTQPDGFSGDIIGKGTGTAANGSRTETFEPGMVEYLRPGEQVEFGSPASNGSYNEYIAGQLRRVAAGVGVMYEQMTGDLSRINYSSYRAGSLEFRRSIEMFQYTTLIPRMCSPIRDAVISTAHAAGRLPSADLKATWTTPKWDWVDPEKDVKANIAAVRNGFTSLSEVIRQQGYDRDELFAEIKEDQKAMDALGLKFDSDARVPEGGAAPASPPAGDAEESTDKTKDKAKDKSGDSTDE